MCASRVLGHKVKRLVVLRWHLQWLMNDVEVVVEEKRRGGVGSVVRSDNSERALPELVLLVIWRREVRARAVVTVCGTVRQPEVNGFDLIAALRPRWLHRRRGLAAVQSLGPVIICVVKISKARFVAAPRRCVVERGHSCVPLTYLVCRVPRLAHLGGDACHCARDAGEAGDKVGGVPNVRGCIADVHVRGQAPRLQRRSRGRAEAERIRAVQFDAARDKCIEVWSLYFTVGALGRVVPAGWGCRGAG